MNDIKRLLNLFKPAGLSLIAVLILLILALFMPPIKRDRPVFTLQLSFDISQSMNAEDMLLNGKKVSRLQFARAAAEVLLQRLPCGSRVGWSVFTGQRIVTLTTPVDVCLHYDALLSTLANVDGRMRWSNASSVGKGLHQSLRAVKFADNGAAVIYISDGHEAPPLRDGQSGIPDTSRLSIDGVIVGVGGARPVKIPKTDDGGQVVGYWQADEVIPRWESTAQENREHLSYLHTEHLFKLAQLTGLIYTTLDSPDVLADVILAAPFAEVKSTTVEMFHLPAALALLVLCWRFLPWRRIDRTKSITIRHG